MSIFKTMAVRDVAEATKAIPVIDVGPAFRGEPGGMDAVAAQVRRASEDVGFFYVAGHGVPEEVVEAAFAGLARVPRDAARRQAGAADQREQHRLPAR